MRDLKAGIDTLIKVKNEFEQKEYVQAMQDLAKMIGFLKNAIEKCAEGTCW